MVVAEIIKFMYRMIYLVSSDNDIVIVINTSMAIAAGYDT